MGSLIYDEEQLGLVGKQAWWKHAVFYQVYPASFKDSNGDGWGDLPGLISKIDYLAQLGVDVIWVSPIFESPQKDMGYDVSDYQKIYAPYGTIEDVDTLVRECHKRQLKVILDLVVNHTSTEHEWFKQSRSSKDDPKRDWYIWKPARYDENGTRHPPTNWRGYFAGPTWTWDEQTQEYYLHLYAPDQPDLNWENDECREAIYDNTMKFWLDRGVDGFRIDTVNKYSKRAYVDVPVTDPTSPHQPAPEMWCNGPRIHEFIHEMNRKVLSPYNAVSVGELSLTPHPSQVIPYVSAASKELDMVFEFTMIRLGNGNGFGSKYIYQPFPLSTLKAVTHKWQSFIEGTDAWTTVFCENHDNGRAVNRFGDASTPEWWLKSSKTLALWQATLTGSLFLYQGQEIGMTNMPESWGIEEYKDIESSNFYAEAVDSGDEKRIQDTMHGLQIMARDHARIPFQWDDSPNAGFTDGTSKPWMRVHDDYPRINVANQTEDPNSILNFYRKALRVRKQHRDLFVFGSFKLLDPADEQTFAYVKEFPVNTQDQRSGKKRRAVVVLNMSQEEKECLNVSKALGCSPDEVHLPHGCTVTSAKIHGKSFWAQAGWLDVVLSNETPDSFFIKVMSGEEGKNMIMGEFESMNAVHDVLPQFAPRPVVWGTYTRIPETHFFLCEFREMTTDMPEPESFAALLSALHQRSVSPTGKFGFHVTTYAGSLPQFVAWESSCEVFFAKSMRWALDLEMERKGASEELDVLSGALSDKVIPRLLRPLESDGRKVKPSLIHGDLWNANAGISVKDGQPLVFDACCFYAHKEYEFGQWQLACNKFGPEYITAYNSFVERSSPQEDFEGRLDLYRL
ncbi:glycoside hydrolase superfamily [Mariannaea sp. PMI_226]|nr:glycoside hydrolase superfamily [Mariannaea sp. PMI_226]